MRPAGAGGSHGDVGFSTQAAMDGSRTFQRGRMRSAVGVHWAPLGLRALSVVLAVGEGAGGLLLAYEWDLPPGPVIAALGGVVFGLVAVTSGLAGRRRAPAEAGA